MYFFLFLIVLQTILYEYFHNYYCKKKIEGARKFITTKNHQNRVDIVPAHTVFGVCRVLTDNYSFTVEKQEGLWHIKMR